MFSSPLHWLGVATNLAGQATQFVSNAVAVPKTGGEEFADVLGGTPSPVEAARQRWQEFLREQGVASETATNIRAELRPDGRIDLRSPENGEPRPGWTAQLEQAWNQSSEAISVGQNAFAAGMRHLGSR